MDDREALSFIAWALSPSRDPALQSELEQIVARGVAWERVVRLASEHLVTPALHGRLLSRNLLPRLDDDLQSYLETVAELNRRRNHAAIRQLAEITCALNALGVQPVLLKGAALLLSGVYADPAERVIRDLDILVRPEDLAASVRGLAELGYTPLDVSRDYRHHHHLAPLGKADRLLTVELHRQVVPTVYQRRFPAARFIERSSTFFWQGSTVLLPAPDDMFVHNAIHHQLADRNLWAGGFLLREALDLVALAGRSPERIATPALADRLRRDAGLLCSAFYVPSAFAVFQLENPLQEQAGRRSLVSPERWMIGLYQLYASRSSGPLRAATDLVAHTVRLLRRGEHPGHRRQLTRKVLRKVGRRAAEMWHARID